MHINAIKSALGAASPYSGQLQPLAQPSWGTADVPGKGTTWGSSCIQRCRLEMPTARSWLPSSGPAPQPRVLHPAAASERSSDPAKSSALAPCAAKALGQTQSSGGKFLAFSMGFCCCARRLSPARTLLFMDRNENKMRER